MVKSHAGTKGGKANTLALRCATIPGNMRTHHDLAQTHAELEQLVGESIGGGGFLGKTPAKPDVLANLWFVRAGHEFAAAAAADLAHASHIHFATTVLLPMSKKIVQQFITEHGMDGVRMDD